MSPQDYRALSSRDVPMRVIVCGLHRTGTMSIRSALWQLGFHDCYHMASVRQSQHHAQLWIRAFEAKYSGKGSFIKADWDALLGQSQACCDIPAALFSAELSEVYPEAKVIILNRDPEEWYESVLNSIYNLSILVTLGRIYCRIFDPQTYNMWQFNIVMRSQAMGFNHPKEREKAVSWFNAQYEEFRDRIPPERRIEYTIQEGWKPLCEHLGVPIPTVKDATTGELVEAPFPRINDRKAFALRRQRSQKRAISRANTNLLAGVGSITLAGSICYGVYFVWKALTARAGRI